MYVICGLFLLAIFASLPCWITNQLIQWAGRGGGQKLTAVLACLGLGVGEGFIGYWLFEGISTGPPTFTRDGYVQEYFSMPIAGVGAMVVGGLVTIFGPLACLAASGKETDPYG